MAGDWLVLEVALRDSFLNTVVDVSVLAGVACVLQLEGPGNGQTNTLILAQTSPSQNRCGMGACNWITR